MVKKVRRKGRDEKDLPCCGMETTTKSSEDRADARVFQLGVEWSFVKLAVTIGIPDPVSCSPVPPAGDPRSGQDRSTLLLTGTPPPPSP